MEAIWLTRRPFAEDLVAKWGIREGSEWLNYKLPDENDEDGSPEEIKEAQAITGALLWLASKRRPDIAVAVVAMSDQERNAGGEHGKGCVEVRQGHHGAGAQLWSGGGLGLT